MACAVLACALCRALSGLLALAGEPAAEPAASAADRAARWSITLHDGKEDQAAFEVRGIDAGSLAELARLPARDPRWPAIFRVYAAPGGEPATQRPAMAGKYLVDDGMLRFVPRFGLEPGLEYRAVFEPGQLPETLDEDAEEVTRVFELPAAASEAPAAKVVEVYPTADRLPENQLKFYIHFSAPMRRGDAYEHLSLLGPDGVPVELPFLELGEELWDREGRRFTVFFDPGRIKRGLRPREEFGPVLEEGKRYTLVIHEGWRDAEGRPLAAEYRKSFESGPPDDVSPDPKQWTLEPPRAGGRDALVVHLEGPLDHALLLRLLHVADAEGQQLEGRAAVSDNETRWQFVPRKPWRAERHRLVIDTRLEDLAGNSVGRPFEVDLAEPISRQAQSDSVSLDFTPEKGR